MRGPYGPCAQATARRAKFKVQSARREIQNQIGKIADGSNLQTRRMIGHAWLRVYRIRPESESALQSRSHSLRSIPACRKILPSNLGPISDPSGLGIVREKFPFCMNSC